VHLTEAERAALRAQDFAFYDWGPESARFVTAWNTRPEDAAALGNAIAAL
jgi:threonine aldolase